MFTRVIYINSAIIWVFQSFHKVAKMFKFTLHPLQKPQEEQQHRQQEEQQEEEEQQQQQRCCTFIERFAISTIMLMLITLVVVVFVYKSHIRKDQVIIAVDVTSDKYHELLINFITTDDNCPFDFPLDEYNSVKVGVCWSDKLLKHPVIRFKRSNANDFDVKMTLDEWNEFQKKIGLINAHLNVGYFYLRKRLEKALDTKHVAELNKLVNANSCYWNFSLGDLRVNVCLRMRPERPKRIKPVIDIRKFNKDNKTTIFGVNLTLNRYTNLINFKELINAAIIDIKRL